MKVGDSGERTTRGWDHGGRRAHRGYIDGCEQPLSALAGSSAAAGSDAWVKREIVFSPRCGEAELAGGFDRGVPQGVGVGGKREGDQASCSTVIRPAIAIAASWASSTARSPTMWQPRMVCSCRSTTSLQKPVVRPSMIGRGTDVEPLGRNDHLAGLSGRHLGEPDGRVFGVGEAADGADFGGEGGGGTGHGIGCREVASRTASWTTIRRPVTSPAAKMCGALVRSSASTCT